MIFSLYRIISVLGSPFILFLLSRRLSRGKENRYRFSERLGVPSRIRPKGLLIWLHGASVGESIAMLPLINRIRKDRPEWNVLVTTGTVTSATLMVERLPEGAFHQFVPVDRMAYISRFLNYWKPTLILWTESEFWPNTIGLIGEKKIPILLLNGRVSEKSFKFWKIFPKVIKKLIGTFSLCLSQSESDAFRLNALGAKDTKYVGNLKLASLPLPVDKEAFEEFSTLTKDRYCWVSASTHEGEEEIIGRIHKSLKAKKPEILSVIVPRHPGRGVEIAKTLKTMGLNVALRSKKDNLKSDIDIYIVDTLGELGLFYKIAEIVFMGKSLLHFGGQNPLEPARLNCAIITGPHMENFKEITANFTKRNAFIQVKNEADLLRSISNLLCDTVKRQKLAEGALQVANEQDDVLEAVFNEIQPYLGLKL